MKKTVNLLGYVRPTTLIRNISARNVLLITSPSDWGKQGQGNFTFSTEDDDQWN